MEINETMAKYLAMQDQQTTASRGSFGETVQSAQSPGAPTDSASVFGRLVIGSEQIQQMAAAAEQRLASLLSRAVGPMPAPPDANRPEPPPAGALDLRLTGALRSLKRVHATLNQLEKVI
jgi:hypothetical protein